MSRESTRRQFLAAGCAASAATLAGCGGRKSGSGNNATTDWYYGESNKQLSQEMVSIVNERDSMDIKLRHGGTSIGAIQRLRDKTGEYAVVGADIAYFAIQGAGLPEIESKFTNIRGVMSLYPMPVTIVARPDVEAETLSDLSDATVNVGKPGTRLASNSKQILNKSNAQVSLTNVTLSNALTKLKEGALDATFAVGNWPIAAVQQAAPDIKVLALRNKVRSNVVATTDWFVKTQLPAGIYDGVDYITPTVGMMALLLTRRYVNRGAVAVLTSRYLDPSKDGDIETLSAYVPQNGEYDKARRGIPNQLDLHDGAQSIII